MSWDLLVLGGGMAGLTAAARAASDGARVLLLEKAQRCGGTATLSRGSVWTAASYDALRGLDPDGDAALAAALVEDFPAAFAWVRALGVDCRPPEQVNRIGQGHRIDVSGYVRECEGAIRRSGGRLRTGIVAEKLLIESERVVGATIRDQDGAREDVAARWTLLATGSFPASPELLARHVHPGLASIPLRASAHSVGDGLRLGQSAGAAIGREGASFYGHLIAYPVAFDDPALFGPLTQRHSDRGVLLDAAGRRFTDETLGDHRNAQAVLDRPRARALLVTDDVTMSEPSRPTTVPESGALTGGDMFRLALKHGAHGAIASSLDELSDLPEEWGYDARAAVETLHELDRLVKESVEQLRPRRAHSVRGLERPPFYVLEVQPAVTFSYVGLLIDTDTRVLDGSARPIPGLLAAGADIGGLYVRGYAGSLAACLVFGLRAARTAVAGVAARAQRV